MSQPDRQAWREGAMTPIGSILERNIILNGADVLTAKGYTQVPNHVLVSDRLSPGAKLTYAMLRKYAWQNDSCFPARNAWPRTWASPIAACGPTCRSLSASSSS